MWNGRRRRSRVFVGGKGGGRSSGGLWGRIGGRRGAGVELGLGEVGIGWLWWWWG